jgi:hypothetical protein
MLLRTFVYMTHSYCSTYEIFPADFLLHIAIANERSTNSLNFAVPEAWYIGPTVIVQLANR